MFIHIYNKTCHSSIPDSKTAAYGHQSNSGRYMLGQYRTAVISKWHSYLDFADVEINIHGTAGVIEIGAPQIPWNSMELLASSKLAHLEHMELLVSAKLANSKFHGIPRNCSCQRNWHTPSSMEFHGIPWNCSCQWNWRTASSMEFHGTSRVSEIGAFQVPWNSMELLVSAKLAHFKFHGIPWNCSCQRNWRTLSSMEFHGIPWNCSSHRIWRTQISMEFHGTALVIEIGVLLVPWNSMELLMSSKLAHS